MKFKEKIRVLYVKVKGKPLQFIKDRKKRNLLIYALILIIIAGSGSYIFFKTYMKKNAVAIVNGEVITIPELREKIASYPEFYKEYVKQLPQQALEDFIGERLLLQKAKQFAPRYRKKIKKALEEYRKELLIREFLSDQVLSKIEVSQDEIKSYYNSNLKDFFVP